MKPSSNRNQHGLKDSTEMYRNIKVKGIQVYFEHWTSDQSTFESEILEAKKLGLRTKIIKGELFRENPNYFKEISKKEPQNDN